ncbi:MAG TPA: hypothetical protein VGL49_04870, partial [Acidimicrobiales bacterium]
VVFAGGLVWYATLIGLHPEFWARWLPGGVLAGLGIGLTFPVMSAAAVSSLPGDRFAVGSAVNQTARQVGGSIGVALLVAILGTPLTAAAALTGFRHLWLFAGTMAALSGAVSILLGPATRPELVPAVEAGTPALAASAEAVG